MSAKNNKKKNPKLLIVFPLIFLDQLFKFLVINFNLLPTAFNQGISFGFLPSNLWIVINISLLTLLFFLLIKKPTLPLLLIFSGGLSNLADRITRGGIVDFIQLPFFPWKFNIADLFITGGLLLFIINFFKNESAES